MATKSAKPGTPGKPGTAESVLCVLKLPCCRCVDGTATDIRIDTGAAPWRVTTPTSLYQQAAIIVASPPGAWTTLLAPAAWVGPPGASEDVGNYEYELQFYVPDCIIPAHIYVSGQAAADNRASIYLDTTPVSPPVPGFGNSDVTSFITLPVTGTGIHKLRFVVTNDGGPTGLVVSAAITVRCPEQLEHDPFDGTLTTDGTSLD